MNVCFSINIIILKVRYFLVAILGFINLENSLNGTELFRLLSLTTQIINIKVDKMFVKHFVFLSDAAIKAPVPR